MVKGRIVSASFDVFPAPKGASTHIEAFAEILGKKFGSVDLITVENPDLEWKSESTRILDRLAVFGVQHHALVCHGRDMIARALMFRSRIAHWLKDQARANVIHVRSIFEGFPIAKRKAELCDYFVYECNGLPSIELKYHYAQVAEDSDLLEKLRFQENTCLRAADLIVTPSAVTAQHLKSRGISGSKIRVIPNGVDLDTFTYQKPNASKEGELKILYCGTMTVWQGVHHAIEALKLYRRDAPATLTLVGPVKKKQRRKMLDQIQAQGLSPYVQILDPVSKPELARLHHASDVVLVPLPANDRNTVQGCCPLKFLEAMATGTPVVVSELDVTRALVADESQAVFVRPNSAKAIKDGLFRFRDEPGLAQQVSQAARHHIEENFQWIYVQAALVNAYEEMFQGALTASKASTTTFSASSSFRD